MLTLPTSLALGALAVLTYLISLVIYRLYLSPISHIPGPKLAALTHFYESYYDVYPNKGQFMFHYMDLHKKYGPIIRISPTEVHIDDMSFYSEIYTGHARKRDKDPRWFWFTGVDAVGGRSTWGTLEHDLHRSRRAAFGQFFSRSKVLELQGRVEEKVISLRENMLKWVDKKEPLDLLNAMSALTLEVITEYVFGRSIPVLEKDEMAGGIVELMRNGSSIHPLARAFPTVMRRMLTLPDWLMPQTAQFKFIQVFKRHVDDCARGAFDEAMKDEKRRHDDNIPTVLYEMVHSSDLSAAEKDFARVKNDATIFIGAGMETTGRTLAVTFYHILADPSIHKRLVSELRTEIPSPTSPIPSLAALEKLPYLTAVITEGLRIGHGVAGRLARVAPDEDLLYHGIKIPRGTGMSSTNYMIHMNPDVFPNPHEFHPERFLAETPGSETAHRNFVPFGKGARMCVGMNLAWSELYLTVAILFTTLKMELAPTTTERDVEMEMEYFIGVLPASAKIGVKVLGRL